VAGLIKLGAAVDAQTKVYRCSVLFHLEEASFPRTNMQDHKNTPLHFASSCGNADAIAKLLACGANPTLTNGVSPYFCASWAFFHPPPPLSRMARPTSKLPTVPHLSARARSCFRSVQYCSSVSFVVTHEPPFFDMFNNHSGTASELRRRIQEPARPVSAIAAQEADAAGPRARWQDVAAARAG
jgi:ankyrin repeat protein